MVGTWVPKDFEYEFDFRSAFMWASLRTRSRLLTGTSLFIPVKPDKEGKRGTTLWFDYFCKLPLIEVAPALEVILRKLDKDFYITRVLLDSEKTSKLFIDLIVKENKESNLLTRKELDALPKMTDPYGPYSEGK